MRGNAIMLSSRYPDQDIPVSVIDGILWSLMQCICTFSRNKRFHTIEYVPISKRIPSRPESRVRVGLSWQVDVGHYCWKPSTATGCGQKKSVMAVCHCEQCAGRLTEDRRMPCLSNTPPQPQPTTTTTTTATTDPSTTTSNTYPTLNPQLRDSKT